MDFTRIVFWDLKEQKPFKLSLFRQAFYRPFAFRPAILRPAAYKPAVFSPVVLGQLFYDASYFQASHYQVRPSGSCHALEARAEVFLKKLLFGDLKPRKIPFKIS